jgi:hypothetical protein
MDGNWTNIPFSADQQQENRMSCLTHRSVRGVQHWHNCLDQMHERHAASDEGGWHTDMNAVGGAQKLLESISTATECICPSDVI